MEAAPAIEGTGARPLPLALVRAALARADGALHREVDGWVRQDAEASQRAGHERGVAEARIEAMRRDLERQGAASMDGTPLGAIHRWEWERQLATYEFPAFAAGCALAHLRQARRWLRLQLRRETAGDGACVTKAQEEVSIAVREAERWQRTAAMITGYPFARREEGAREVDTAAEARALALRLVALRRQGADIEALIRRSAVGGQGLCDTCSGFGWTTREVDEGDGNPWVVSVDCPACGTTGRKQEQGR